MNYKTIIFNKKKEYNKYIKYWINKKYIRNKK